MAIRIPILTSFDPKGLRQANAQFAKLQGSVGSLGRNFAVAGAAIAAAGAVIAKNAQSLARIEAINAQTAQTIRSMGNASKISASEVETLAGSLESLTAVEAESIQEGANLLLTFGNIRNEMGAGNDIFTQTTKIMVDMGVALKKGPVATATMLGKALNDPIKGMTALTRVGVSFTKQQIEQVKALQNSGDLMGAQKLILAELQNQYGGSGAAFAKTFTGQLELMGHELGTIGEEATMAVMPALQDMVKELRALIPIIGPQLKAAIASVDWKALITSVVNFTKFLIQNGETLAKIAIALFALNTAYKVLAIGVGISKVAIELHKWAVAQSTAGMGAATIAANGLRIALLAVAPFAVVAGITAIGAAMVAVSKDARLASSGVKSLYEETQSDLIANPWKQAVNPGKVYIGLIRDAKGETSGLKAELLNLPKKINVDIVLDVQMESRIRNRELQSYLGFLGERGGITDTGAGYKAGSTTTTTTTTGGAARPSASPLQQIINDSKKNATVIKKQSTLERKGLSAEVAAWVTSSAKPVKAANQAIQRITKNGDKAIANLTKAYTNSAAGQAAAAAAAASEITESFTVAYDDTADKEAAALAERERVFQSFTDSVKATFAGMKNGIINAFDLSELGGSSNAITRNMEKLLTRLRSFANNVKSLASMGLNPALLQQVISAGPMGGARLAEALVMGGAGGLSALNAGYSEFGALSSQIAQTGTESLFGTGQQQSVYNINVDGGVGSGATIGKAIVDAIKAYERTSGAVWQGA
jgi:hypothetical protein